MPKYRKKPVEVDAEQWWPGTVVRGVDLGTLEAPQPFVTTIHGQKAYLRPGDWVIAEPDGVHYYPCAPDIFPNIYESAEGPDRMGRALTALRDVVNPVAYLERTKEPGTKINGAGVVAFLSDPVSYVGIAREALRELEQEGN